MSEDAHRYGTSISNQRIENWSSHIRKGFTNWVIEIGIATAIGIPITYVNHDMILLLTSQMRCFIYLRTLVMSIESMTLLT